jgi:hypothetical protein
MRDEQTSDWWIIVIVAALSVFISKKLLRISPKTLVRIESLDVELSETFGRSAQSEFGDLEMSGEETVSLIQPRRRSLTRRQIATTVL